MAFNRLFQVLYCKSVTRLAKWIKSCTQTRERKPIYTMKDAWSGREGDAGGFEFEMLVQLLDQHHPTRSKKHYLFDGILRRHVPLKMHNTW